MKAVVIFSGGLDSSVLLGSIKRWGGNPLALTIDYGQRNWNEITSAMNVAEHVGCPHEVIQLPQLSNVFGKNALTDSDMPLPQVHYESVENKAVAVPNRNMILLAIAAARAITEGYDTVAYGAHKRPVTRAALPDCRPEFVESMRAPLALCHQSGILLHAPFTEMDKSEIVSLGNRLGVPFELTWSCYDNKGVHCGKCGTCVERREAFKLAGIPDPTIYEA